MNVNKHLAIAAIAMSVVLTQAHADAPAATMQPMQGTTHDVGAERAVTYFLSDGGQCKVVMTIAGASDPGSSTFSATRYEATIDGGKTTRFVTDKGGIVDFDCEPSAQMVNIRTLEPASSVAVR
jgi:hypothetical protein